MIGILKAKPPRAARLRLKKFRGMSWRAAFEREMAARCEIARTCAELRRENETLRKRLGEGK